MSKKIGMISLGCPKNQIDAEIMLAAAAERGFEITDSVDGADAVIINLRLYRGCKKGSY